MGSISKNDPSVILSLFVVQVSTSAVAWYFVQSGWTGTRILGLNSAREGMVYHNLVGTPLKYVVGHLKRVASIWTWWWKVWFTLLEIYERNEKGFLSEWRMYLWLYKDVVVMRCVLGVWRNFLWFCVEVSSYVGLLERRGIWWVFGGPFCRMFCHLRTIIFMHLIINIRIKYSMNTQYFMYSR